MEGEVLEINGIDFSTPLRRVVKRAAFYDTIVVVGSPMSFASRVEVYRSLGVDAKLYPLRSHDAPFLLSLLGLLGWLEERRREGKRVLVELEDGQATIPAALMILNGHGVFHALRYLELHGFSLQNPLQARILVLLWVLRETHIPLDQLSKRYSRTAFTSTDFYYSLMIEHITEHYYHLYRLIPLRLKPMFDNVLKPRLPALTTNEERVILSIASTLSHSTMLAVRNVTVVTARRVMKVYIGCSMLFHGDGCWPEVDKSRGYYEALAKRAGAEKLSIHVTYPEEAACLAYGDIYQGGCGAERSLF